MWGTNVAFGGIPLSGFGGDSVTGKWTDDGRTDGRTEKNNTAFVLLYHKGKKCSKFGRIPLSGLDGDSLTDRRTDEHNE